jgi:periplasmic protein TonB
MEPDQNTLRLEGLTVLAGEFAAGRNEWRPGFMIALTCAALVHAAFIGWVGQSPPRYVGGPGGSTTAINVEIVDEADLRERGSGADAAEAGGSQVAPTGAQPVQTPAEAQESAPQPDAPDASDAQDAVKAPEAPDASDAPDARDAADAQDAEAAAADKKPAVAVPAPSTDTQQPSPSDEVPKAGQPKADTEAKPAPRQKESRPAPKKQALAPPQLDLSVPLGLTLRESANVGSSSATRPAGITRSAENDRFGRDVIRALRKTMPTLPDAKGRVTVRIFLDQKGNIAKLQLVQSGGDTFLDQNVIFSARQTAFPYPPKGARRADLTFLITYVYR